MSDVKNYQVTTKMDYEHHHNNWGVYISPDSTPKDIKLCWCRLHHIFKTHHLIDDVILDNFGHRLHCYRLLNVSSELPINKVVSQAEKKTIRGPVFFCYDYQDTHSPEILDYLLSR